MSGAELARVVAFGAVVGTVYVLAALELARQIRGWVRRKPAMLTPRARWTRRALYATAIAGVCCMGYGWLVEPYRLEITHHRLATTKLPSGMRPIRIVHLTDLHCDATVRLEERLPGAVAAEKPDLILFTGDAVNSPEGLPVFRACLTRLAAIAPTYVVSGNWEESNWPGLGAFAGTGARELRGEAIPVTVDGRTLWLVGVTADGVHHAARALATVPAEAYVVFLYHYPDDVPAVLDRGVDLYLCGHTHGGQVALPLYGALVTLAPQGKKYEAGLYRVRDTWLYVNRGIGMEGGPAPRVRFGSVPEIAVFEIAPG